MRMQIPTVDVKYSAINITSLKNKTATIFVQTRKANSKTGRWSKGRLVEVKLSKELVKWLWQRHSNGQTGFQKFLAKKEIPFYTGILKDLVFISNNLSEDYYENPFKIIEYKDGSTQLTLTHLRPQKYNSQTKKFEQPYKAFYRKESYRRYAIEQ